MLAARWRRVTRREMGMPGRRKKPGLTCLSDRSYLRCGWSEGKPSQALKSPGQRLAGADSPAKHFPRIEASIRGDSGSSLLRGAGDELPSLLGGWEVAWPGRR